MKLIFNYDEYYKMAKQVENVYKQDSMTKGDSQIFILHVKPELLKTGSKIPVFYKTRSIQMCQMITVEDYSFEQNENSKENIDLEFTVTSVMDILNSFDSKELPNKIHIRYQAKSSFISFVLFESDTETVLPAHYYFKLPALSPERYIIDEFEGIDTLDNAVYTTIPINQYENLLNKYISLYKDLPSHLKQKTYLRFTSNLIYLRTMMGMVFYKNNISIFQNVNLIEDAVKMLYVVAHSYNEVDISIDRKNAKIFIRLPSEQGVCVLDYRTRYNEDDKIPEIMRLTHKSETITFNLKQLIFNLRRIENFEDTTFYVRQRGAVKVLSMVNTKVMQSQRILHSVGELYNQVGFKLNAGVVLNMLKPSIKTGVETIDLHLGLQKVNSVLTLGFTDENQQYYSLFSVTAVLEDKLDKIKDEYKDYKF